jgi:hypothetical protein
MERKSIVPGSQEKTKILAGPLLSKKQGGGFNRNLAFVADLRALTLPALIMFSRDATAEGDWRELLAG